MPDGITDSKDFLPHYKAAIDKANQKIKEGAVSVMAICEEQTQSAGTDLTYKLHISPDIEVTIVKKKVKTPHGGH